MRVYDELSIRITPSPTDSYDVFATHASESGRSEERGTFKIPFHDREVDDFVQQVGLTGHPIGQLESRGMDLAKQFGGRLFEALFHKQVRSAYDKSLSRSLSSVSDSAKGLRISLNLSEAPKLFDLPWEYLYDSGSNKFLALLNDTPIVRYMNLGDPPRSLPVNPPLRVIGVISDPSDLGPIDVDNEIDKLNKALQTLIDEGYVKVSWSAPTLQALSRELRGDKYHIFHFVGHGRFDSHSQQGALTFKDETGKGYDVSGEMLANTLGNYRSIRLAVLNACEGARVAAANPFAGVATALVQREIPAVIAMQFKVTNSAAVHFAGGLYEALVDSYPVDEALAEARRAIYFSGNDIEWGTPALFLRVPDGRIFDVQRRVAPLSDRTSPSRSHTSVVKSQTERIQGITIPVDQRILAELNRSQESLRDFVEEWGRSSHRLSMWIEIQKSLRSRPESGDDDWDYWRTVGARIDQLDEDVRRSSDSVDVYGVRDHFENLLRLCQEIQDPINAASGGEWSADDLLENIGRRIGQMGAEIKAMDSAVGDEVRVKVGSLRRLIEEIFYKAEAERVPVRSGATAHLDLADRRKEGSGGHAGAYGSGDRSVKTRVGFSEGVGGTRVRAAHSVGMGSGGAAHSRGHITGPNIDE